MVPTRSPLLLLVAGVFSFVAHAQTVQTLVTYSGPDPGGSGCTTPSSVTQVFSSSDTSVNVYMFLNGMNQGGGDVVKLYWYGPNGNLDVTTTWDTTTGGYSNWCFSTHLSITQYIAPNGWGQWQLQAYVNGVAVGSRVNVSINQAGGTTPPTSSIRTGNVVTLPNSTTSTVYYVHPTGLYPFPSADVFYSWGFQFSDVTTANSAEVALPIKTNIITAKLPGCSDPVSQINGTCGATTTTSVNWTSAGKPPTVLSSGQSFTVGWQVAGPSSVQSRVCWGNDANAQNCLQQSSWQYGSGTFSAALTAPSVNNLANYYFIVQAQANGQNYWSDSATSLVSGTVISNANQWTYNTDADGTPRSGWWARLVKTPISGNRYKYSLYLFLSAGGAIQNVSAAVISDLRIGMVRGSYGSQVTQDWAPQPYTTGFQWSGPPDFDRANSITNIAFDIWGFANPDVGVIWGAKDIIDNLRDLSRTTIGPSSWLTDKMLDENSYRVSRMAYTPSNGIFTALQNISGVSFSVTVDENSGLQPEFFLRAETKLGTVIGVEIGLDRNALVNTAYWNAF